MYFDKIKEELICEKAYLYSLWTGRIRVFEGKVIKINNGYRTKIRHIDDDTKMSRDCGEGSGVVANKMLWLPEKDEGKAREIFIEYERMQIKRLEEQIHNHEDVIEILENES